MQIAAPLQTEDDVSVSEPQAPLAPEPGDEVEAQELPPNQLLDAAALRSQRQSVAKLGSTLVDAAIPGDVNQPDVQLSGTDISGADDGFEDFDEEDFDDDFDDDFEEEVEGEYELLDDEYGNEFNEMTGGLDGSITKDDADSEEEE